MKLRKCQRDVVSLGATSSPYVLISLAVHVAVHTAIVLQSTGNLANPFPEGFHADWDKRCLVGQRQGKGMLSWRLRWSRGAAI